MKTNTKNIAKPALPLIIFGIIKGYINKPVRFIFGTLFTFSKFYKSINSDLPKEFIKSNAFIVHLYKRLQKIVPKDKAYEIIRAAVLCSGLSVMQANFRNVEAVRNFENLVKYQQKAKDEGATKLNQVKIISKTDNCYKYKVTRCMFYEFYSSTNTPELTKIMCSVDNAIFNTYLPNEIVFERGIGNTMPEGAKECYFCIKKCDRKLKQEEEI